MIQPNGHRSWAVRFRFHGQPKKIKLAGSLTLAAARREASAALHQVEQGTDPAEQRQAAKAKAIAAREDTVQAICEQYLKREGPKLRTLADVEATLRRNVYPVLGSRQINSVKRTEITRLLDKIEDKVKGRRGNSGERTADLVLAYLRRVFHWHEKRTDEFRSPIIRGMSRYSIAAHARERWLDDDELKKLWAASAAPGPFPALIRFLLLTACRRSEGTRAGVDPDIAERCVGHKIPGIRGTYDRHPYYPEMKMAFEALASLIERIVNPPEGNLLQFPQRTRH